MRDGSGPALPGGRRSAVVVVGVLLLWGTLGGAGYVLGWQSHLRRAAAALVGHERHVIASAAPHHRVCVVDPPRSGQLTGLLQIPSLGLTAPVEEGTDDAELSVAVGHDPASVWPGQSGTAVLLAHDVSYFVHIDQLQTGDRISYRSPCTTVTYTVTGHRIVSQGSPVPDTPAPTLVLDTCYPPNALFFTSQRLLVQATESVVRTAAGPLTAASSGPPTAFRVNVPPALADQGLTLEQNEAPMGTMTLRGQPTRSWEQSPGPLNLEASALEAYFGGLHATHEQVPDWWEAIAPRVLPPQPLLGATITGHDSPLDVEIDASAGQPVAVVLRTTVTLSGGPAPGTYAEVVASRVTGSTLTVSRWGMSAT